MDVTFRFLIKKITTEIKTRKKSKIMLKRSENERPDEAKHEVGIRLMIMNDRLNILNITFGHAPSTLSWR